MGSDDRWVDARREVESLSKNYYYSPQQMGIDRRTKRFVVERCRTWIRPVNVLDLGYVDGEWADEALGRGCAVDIVEGATRHVAEARTRYDKAATVRVFHSLFQEFEPDRSYDTVIAGDMLRYLPDPVGFLGRVREWLRPGGNLIVTVPNVRSLHRRIGAAMGLEATPETPNARDLEVGNRRSYEIYSLRAELRQAGFEIVTLRGCFLKPLSSAQMETWSDELLRAFLTIGDELGDYCWFIYALCRRPDTE